MVFVRIIIDNVIALKDFKGEIVASTFVPSALPGPINQSVLMMPTMMKSAPIWVYVIEKLVCVNARMDLREKLVSANPARMAAVETANVNQCYTTPKSKILVKELFTNTLIIGMQK